MEIRGHSGRSRPISESDLQALEMLDPESSSHDDSISSTDQLEAAVSLSVLSVGISAVRERSQREQQQQMVPPTGHTPSPPTRSVLVIMPGRTSEYEEEETSLMEEREGRSLTERREIVELVSHEDEEREEEQTESGSRSFDLDSSIESSNSGPSRHVTVHHFEGERTMSVITSLAGAPSTLRTSEEENGASLRLRRREEGEERVPVLEMGPSSSNGSTGEERRGEMATGDRETTDDRRTRTTTGIETEREGD